MMIAASVILFAVISGTSTAPDASIPAPAQKHAADPADKSQWTFVAFERPEFPVAHTLSALHNATDSHKKLIQDLKSSGLIWLHSGLTGKGVMQEFMILRTDDLDKVNALLRSDSSITGGFTEYKAYLMPRQAIKNSYKGVRQG